MQFQPSAPAGPPLTCRWKYEASSLARLTPFPINAKYRWRRDGRSLNKRTILNNSLLHHIPYTSTVTMEVAGVSLALPPLLAECGKLAKQCHDLQSKYQHAPASLSYIITECNAVTYNISELKDLDIRHLRECKREAFRRHIDSQVLGCISLLSTIEQDLESFRGVAEDEGVIVGPSRRFRRRDRMRFVWNEDHVMGLLQKLRGLETSLLLSLSLLKFPEQNDMRQIVETQNVILASCLQRHHSSTGQHNTRGSYRLSQDTVLSRTSERSSLLSDTKFDFDNEAINSRAYRQAMARRRIKKIVSAPTKQLQQKHSSQEIASVDAVFSLHVVPSLRQSVMGDFEDLVSEVESVFSESLSTYSSVLDLYMSNGGSAQEMPEFIAEPLEGDQSSLPTFSHTEEFGESVADSLSSETKNRCDDTRDSSVPSYFGGNDAMGDGHDSIPEVTYRTESSRFSIGSFRSQATNEPEAPTVVSSNISAKRQDALKALSANGSSGSRTSFERSPSAATQRRNSAPSHSLRTNSLEQDINAGFSAPEQRDPWDKTWRFSTSSEQITAQRRISAPLLGGSHRISLEEQRDDLFDQKNKTARPPSIRSSPQVVEKSAGSIKCVLVGDAARLKTKMLFAYSEGKLSNGYVPTIFHDQALTVMVGRDAYTVGLFDTTGAEEYDSIRAQTYPNTDIFLVCSDVERIDHFESVPEWMRELNQYPQALKILVGATDSDDSEDEDSEAPADNQEKRRRKILSRQTGALSYLECDVRTPDTIVDVFSEAIAAVIEQRLRARRRRGRSSGAVKWLREMLQPISEVAAH
ncbi:unnamed protein product [Periconia digitata]|uniref:Uncharacterized protein n=1 Tax=Periconia digitata TaxID=1303443 RepID=A0A9W4XJZ2_9PLEO|nr:unnamed protein product [Periconia digitata]